ncbi:protoporphyrinogen/coproporphyrinogen oxidase [Cellulomonas uda]|uniref:Protoporphyrinogen oxidase n=1 Tax=Cellulomonas uda TaxID=1714 RepID=A0A4Y3KBS0_CELUD|nr:FAD-dependent oxidoreductase [Cellulomonas uda]NII66444.1 oxygen-dependent protoporphyrinogen oxidase [Cellulomonas uda]GEA80290.1 protoporphyrinogen oxidase [Cellulomonas uda]
MTAAAEGPGTERADERWDAVVVGGGVAGLVAARELVRGGLRPLVVEGRDAVGGAVRGHVVAGLELDAGAESFATRGGTVAAYLAELGIADRVVAPSGLGSWVHLPSGDGPLPQTGLLGIPSQPWAPDVRRTLGVLGAARAALDLVLPARVGAGATTLGALVRARMGARVVDRLVRPVVGGVHAAEPDELAVDAVAPGLPGALETSRSLARAVRSLRAAAPAGSAVQGLDGGVHVLVDTLAAQVTQGGGTIRTRTRATGARPADDEPGTVVVTLGDGSSVRTGRLVVAGPQVELLTHVLDLGDVALDEGADVRLVTLVLDAPALDAAPRGTGVLVAREADDVRAKALTHATAKWPWLAGRAPAGRHVVRLSYGRADESDPAEGAGRAAGRAGLGDTDALVAQALVDASVLLGVPVRDEQVVASAVVRWTQALPRPSARHREAVAAVRAALDAPRTDGARVVACGAWLAGNGLASVIPDAVAAGRRALGSLPH